MSAEKAVSCLPRARNFDQSAPVVDVIPVHAVSDGDNAVFDEADDAAEALFRVEFGDDIKEAFPAQGEHFRSAFAIG